MRVKTYGIGSTGNHFKNDSVYKDPYTNNLKKIGKPKFQTG